MLYEVITVVRPDQFPVPQDSDAVRDFIDLTNKMRDKNNSHTFIFESSHHFEELTCLILIQAGCGFIKDEYLRRRDIKRACNRHHLLDRNGI